LTVDQSTFSGNAVNRGNGTGVMSFWGAAQGRAICDLGTLTITNSLFWNNAATGGTVTFSGQG